MKKTCVFLTLALALIIGVTSGCNSSRPQLSVYLNDEGSPAMWRELSDSSLTPPEMLASNNLITLRNDAVGSSEVIDVLIYKQSGSGDDHQKTVSLGKKNAIVIIFEKEDKAPKIVPGGVYGKEFISTQEHDIKASNEVLNAKPRKVSGGVYKSDDHDEYQ